jgi:hypothetical protein
VTSLVSTRGVSEINLGGDHRYIQCSSCLRIGTAIFVAKRGENPNAIRDSTRDCRACIENDVQNADLVFPLAGHHLYVPSSR